MAKVMGQGRFKRTRRNHPTHPKVQSWTWRRQRQSRVIIAWAAKTPPNCNLPDEAPRCLMTRFTACSTSPLSQRPHMVYRY
jgi:hypothetical protein